MGYSFEEFCAATGRRALDLASVPEFERLILSEALERFQELLRNHAATRKPGHEILVGWFDSMQMNAVAATWEGQDFIGLNRGIVHVAHSIFERLCDQEPFNQWVERAATVTYLRECTEFYIFLHEMGHVWDGHTSWVLGTPVPYIAEMGNFPLTDQENLDRRTLEFDADSFAAVNLLQLARHNPPPRIVPAIEAEYGVGGTSLLLMSIAAYASRRIFYAPNEGAEERGTHPSLPLRQAIFITTIATKLLEDDESTADGLVSCVKSGAVWAENAVASILGRSDVPSDFWDKFSEDEWWERTKVLLKNWHHLYPELDKLKRGGRLPTPQILDD